MSVSLWFVPLEVFWLLLFWGFFYAKELKDSSKSLLSFIISVVDSGLMLLFVVPAGVLVWFLGFIEIHFFGLSHVLQDKFA